MAGLKVFTGIIVWFWGATLCSQTMCPSWKQVEGIPANLGSSRQFLPKKYQIFDIEFDALKNWLFQSETDRDTDGAIQILLPMPDGRQLPFLVWETPILLSPLDSKYPNIRTFSGKCVETCLSATVKLDVTPQGFHAMILSPESGTVFIDPYSKGNTRYYLTYFRKDFQGVNTVFNCGFASDWTADQPETRLNKNRMLGDCHFRTYRLALAATGEYTLFHGGVAEALAAQVTTINRVNGVFERDLAIHLNIIGNNDTLIYSDPNGDPYSTNIGPMLSQNQSNLNAKIGTDNFDIGHVFFQNAKPNGLADFQAVCNTQTKARGATGTPMPVGDPFDVSYVMHEMGHQFGAHHSHNNKCEEWAATAVETGSGSTIMSYAGICPPNVQLQSDDYFHIVSLEEITRFVTDTGHTCPVVVPRNNLPPELILDQTEFFIPARTPFVLTALGEDEDNDVLSYCWEQVDSEFSPMPPTNDAGLGPAFRSFPPILSNTRYFPKLEDWAMHTVSPWEVLSVVDRALNFKITLRDNAFDGGCITADSVRVNVIDTGRPFQVAVPGNNAEIWEAGSIQTVHWDVADTDSGVINCSLVDIFLSVDGGLSFPILLQSSLPNSGSASVLIPNSPTEFARLMVRCADNIFYAISDNNFIISESVSSTSPDSKQNGFSIFPNPCKDKCSLRFSDRTTDNISLRLFNHLGELIFERTHQIGSDSIISIDLMNVPAGVYRLTVTSELDQNTQTLLICP